MNLTETTDFTDRDGIVDAVTRLTCYLIGQHHRAGEGPSVHFQDHLLLGNRFETDLVRDHDHGWLVRRNRVSSRWSVGNPAAAAIPTEW